MSADLDVIDVYVLSPQEAKEVALAYVQNARRELDQEKDVLQQKRARLHDEIRAAERVGATQGELLAAARCGHSTLSEVLGKGE